MKKILFGLLAMGIANSSFALLNNCVLDNHVNAQVALQALHNINNFASGVPPIVFNQGAGFGVCSFGAGNLSLSPFQNVGDPEPQISVHEIYEHGQTSEIDLSANGANRCVLINHEVNVPAARRAQLEGNARRVCAAFAQAAAIQLP